MSKGVEAGSELAQFYMNLKKVPCQIYAEEFPAEHSVGYRQYLFVLERLSAIDGGLIDCEMHFIKEPDLLSARASAISVFIARQNEVEPGGYPSGLSLRPGGLLGPDGNFTTPRMLIAMVEAARSRNSY